MHNDLTIITTLVNSGTTKRKIQIERFIKYHLRFNCQIFIIVPDDVNINIQNINYKKITFIHCKSSLSGLEKIYLALKNVSTKFVAWIADDDFLGLDFAKKAINIMNQNDNIAACSGMIIFFEENTIKRADILYSYKSYKRQLNKPKDLYKNQNLKFHADNYHPGVVHAVVKTKALLNVFEFLNKFKMPVSFTDRTMVLIILMHEDIKYIKSLAGIRSFGTRITRHAPHLLNKVEIHPCEIVTYNNLIEKLMREYEKINGSIDFRIRSGIIYFLTIASNCIAPYKKNNFLEKINFLKAYLEPYKLSLFNKQIKEDIILAKKLIKQYPLQ